MRKKILSWGVGLVTLVLGSCAMSWGYNDSPRIEYENHSSQTIYDIQTVWGGYPLLKTKIFPGQTRGQVIPLSQGSLPILQTKIFYGEVYLTWKNADGKKFEKKFTFSEKDMPPEDIGKPKLDAYVVFQFNQEGLIRYFTHHTPGALEQRKKSAKLKQQLRMEWLKKQPR